MSGGYRTGAGCKPILAGLVTRYFATCRAQATVADIAQAIDRNHADVARVLRQLVARGMVRVLGEARNGRGRPAKVYGLCDARPLS